jgi:hypothetical protein
MHLIIPWPSRRNPGLLRLQSLLYKAFNDGWNEPVLQQPTNCLIRNDAAGDFEGRFVPPFAADSALANRQDSLAARLTHSSSGTYPAERWIVDGRSLTSAVMPFWRAAHRQAAVLVSKEYGLKPCGHDTYPPSTAENRSMARLVQPCYRSCWNTPVFADFFCATYAPSRKQIVDVLKGPALPPGYVLGCDGVRFHKRSPQLLLLGYLRADATIYSHRSNRIVPGWQSRVSLEGETADLLRIG